MSLFNQWRLWGMSAQFPPINTQYLQQALATQGCVWLNQVEAFDCIDSTNDYLLNLPGSKHGRVCVAEQQSKGRGRSGNQWLGSQGRSLMFSVGWSPASGKLALISALSLVIGVALMDALKPLGIAGLGLKWPNDLLCGQAKIGGILVESKSQGNKLEVVIGVGMNLSNQAQDMAAVSTSWANLSQCGAQEVNRDALLLDCLFAISQRLEQFEREGFASLRKDWLAYHAFSGAKISYQQEGQAQQGRIMGLSEKGALLLQAGGRTMELTAGEIKMLRLSA